MKAKILIPIISVLAILATVFAYMQYNKPHIDAGEAKPAFEMSATDLFSAFSVNETEAMTEYGNEVILINGKVIDKSTLPDGTLQVILEAGDPIFGVKCQFQNPSAINIELDNTISVKGICSGFNSDVEMTRCVLAN